MRRLTIVVCVLLLPPVPVLACIDHDGPGWFDQIRPSSWQILPSEAVEGLEWWEELGVTRLASAFASVVLLAVVMSRAVWWCRQSRSEPGHPMPLALPFDRPIRVDGS